MSGGDKRQRVNDASRVSSAMPRSIRDAVSALFQENVSESLVAYTRCGRGVHEHRLPNTHPVVSVVLVGQGGVTRIGKR